MAKGPKKKAHLQRSLVPSDKREARAAADPAYWRTQTPLWAFGKMVPDGPFGWDRADPATVRWALGRLDSFASMTWHDILSNTRSHEDTVASIPNDLLAKELARIGLDDVDTLVSLRLGSLPRIWGYRDGRTLLILFWDPDHQGWPTPKKHT